MSDEDVKRVVLRTLKSVPKGATQWSTRSMARECGMSFATVGRLGRAFGLKPHRTETFTLSEDPLFIEKVRNIAGLYLHPPERGVVLCEDEKSQTQTLDRTRPLLPLRPGIPRQQAHDYKRSGTTSLFATLNTAAGEVFGKCYRKHRSVEFKKFLAIIDKTVPPELDVHLILDNYSTHKTAMIHNWLQNRPSFQLHLTPTSASWLNQVERWFAEITSQELRDGSNRSTRAIEKAIKEYSEVYSESPKPFTWTKPAEQIVESLKTFCTRISDSEHWVVAAAEAEVQQRTRARA